MPKYQLIVIDDHMNHGCIDFFICQDAALETAYRFGEEVPGARIWESSESIVLPFEAEFDDIDAANRYVDEETARLKREYGMRHGKQDLGAHIAGYVISHIQAHN